MFALRRGPGDSVCVRDELLASVLPVASRRGTRSVRLLYCCVYCFRFVHCSLSVTVAPTMCCLRPHCVYLYPCLYVPFTGSLLPFVAGRQTQRPEFVVSTEQGEVFGQKTGRARASRDCARLVRLRLYGVDDANVGPTRSGPFRFRSCVSPESIRNRDAVVDETKSRLDPMPIRKDVSAVSPRMVDFCRASPIDLRKGTSRED